LVRYYGYYCNRSRSARRLIENGDDTAGSIRSDEPAANTRRKAAWARLMQKVYEVDPLACVNCGSNVRFSAFIDDVDVVERILKHLKVWDPQPDTLTPAGPDEPRSTAYPLFRPRHQDAAAVFRAPRLNHAIEFPILRTCHVGEPSNG